MARARGTPVSREELDGFFNHFDAMLEGIEGQIDRARSDPARDGGHLTALALIGLTEILGGIRRETFARGAGPANYAAGLRAMGPEYGALLDSGAGAYAYLRSGPASAYLLSGAATVFMFASGEPCGLGKLPDGRYYFVVERYFEDLGAATRELKADLNARHDPRLPAEIAGR